MNPHTSLLTAVTLTGVDSHTDLDRAIALARWAPRVEWGVLYSARRAGQEGRYPTFKEAARILIRLREAGVATAVHLCGGAVPRVLAGEDPVAWELANLARRVQLNFNQARAPLDVGLIDLFADRLGRPVITQHNAANADVHVTLVHPLHQVLFDASGGRGERPAGWDAPLSGKRCGYAGGLSPANVRAELRAMVRAAAGQPFWVDMETSLRDADDRFDLDACARVLAEVDGWAQGR